MAKPQPSGDQAPIIIIKKIKKGGGHGGHHGGAWKVAYADFVTAMMAFFLLMWLLNATSDEQKMGISNYFDPIGVSQGATGAGGVLGGLSVKSDGVLQDVTAEPTLGPPLGQEGQATEQGAGASAGDFASGEGSGEKETGDPSSVKRTDNKQKPSAVTKDKSIADPKATANAQVVAAKPISEKKVEEMTEADAEKLRQQVEQFEQKQFAKAEKDIKQAIDSVPELKEFANHLIVDQTPEGLRIQIVDQAQKSMFPNGSSRMYSYTQKMLESVAHVVASMPNKISVAGHTDSIQYNQRNSYTNWELSTDRANASRRVLLDAGISQQRLYNVVGKADTDPLVKNNPTSPVNRRISIVLLKKSITSPIPIKGTTTPEGGAAVGTTPAPVAAITSDKKLDEATAISFTK